MPWKQTAGTPCTAAVHDGVEWSRDGGCRAPNRGAAPRCRTSRSAGVPRAATSSAVHLTAERAGRAGERRRGRSRRAPPWRVGAAGRPARSRRRCSRSRRRPGCPELVPIRYGRMLVSPFTFYRGAAYLMAADLAGAPRTGLEVQLCGDAHLSNFGGFAAPDRRLVFSINDFDETLPGPFEWDVKRLVASFAVAGRDRGFDAKQRAVDQPGGDAVVPRGDAGASPRCEPRPLVRPPRRRRDRRAGGAAGHRQAAEAVRAQRGQGAVQGQHEGVRQAHDDRRRRAPDRRATRR